MTARRWLVGVCGLIALVIDAARAAWDADPYDLSGCFGDDPPMPEVNSRGGLS